MYDLVGYLTSINFSYQSGKPLLTFEMESKQESLQAAEDLFGKGKLTIKIGEFKKRRSLDANAYCWTLISQIAERLNIPKTDIYRKAIKEIGGNSDIVCVQDKAVKSLCDGWERNGIGWCTDTMPSKIDGCTNVILYYGSSTYDVSTMCRLIDNIVQDCKALGIETRSEEEINSLLGAWAR